jgi:uncharacterized protein YdeI (YjbR/CyaY-like superfamily)
MTDGSIAATSPDGPTAAIKESLAGRSRFDALTPSHRREWERFVAQAIKPETRRRRAEKAAAALAAEAD